LGALALGLLMGLGTVQTVAAHAHVFIQSTVEIVFAGKQVTGLKLRWAFDELFSAGMLNDFDTNRDRSFDTSEVDAIQDMSLASMKEFNYFTHLWVNGELRQEFAAATLDVTAVGGVVVYEWTLSLAEPANPSRDRIEISIFDDSYYCDVVLRMPEPVALRFAPEGCVYRVSEDETKAYYYDSIYPEVISLSCPN
jgi:ABC-type uncharacterized transport system substrate-binding protein